MASERVRVSRALYNQALADAIDWQTSFLESHDPDSGSVQSCCKPGARCPGYEASAKILQRYQRAFAALTNG